MWSEQWGSHSPVGDNGCHYASQTITPCLSLRKRNASLNCFFFVNPALIPLLYSDKILSPLRLFNLVFLIPSSTPLNLPVAHTHTLTGEVTHFPEIPFDSCAFLSLCQVCDIASVTDIWLLLSDVDGCISTLKHGLELKKLVFTPFFHRLTCSQLIADSKQRGRKEMMQFYKDTKYKHNDILTHSFNVMWLWRLLWGSVMSLEVNWK